MEWGAWLQPRPLNRLNGHTEQMAKHACAVHSSVASGKLIPM